MPMVTRVRKGPQEVQIFANFFGKPSSLDHLDSETRKGDAAQHPPPHDRPQSSDQNPDRVGRFVSGIFRGGRKEVSWRLSSRRRDRS
jgi:hypothetical protein